MIIQEKLDFITKAEDVTDDLIMRRCKNLDDAINLCRSCSPLNDKQIIEQIGKLSGDNEMQKSHFSEAMNGCGRNFPPRYIKYLEDICFNWIPTRYMALSRHQELKPKKEAWELENEHLKRLLVEKNKEIEIISKWEKSKRV